MFYSGAQFPIMDAKTLFVCFQLSPNPGLMTNISPQTFRQTLIAFNGFS